MAAQAPKPFEAKSAAPLKRRRFALGASALAGCLFLWTLWRAAQLGIFSGPLAEGPGAPVRLLKGLPSPEDMAAIEASDGSGWTAYVSSCPRAASGEPLEPGRIFALRPANASGALPRSAPLELSGYEEPFHPLGLDLFVAPGGERRLFVVNRGPEAPPTVEIFRVEERRLAHLATLGAGALVEPNDVAAVAPLACHVTESSQFRSGLARSLAIFGGWNRGRLVYLEPGTARVAAEGFGLANGIVRLGEGELLVADTLRASGRRFRDLGGGRLEELPGAALPRGSDNLTLAPDGSVLVAAHANLLALARRRHDPTRPAPTFVGRWRPKGPEGLEPVFADDGAGFGGASVAVALPRGLLLGSPAGEAVGWIPLEDLFQDEH